MNIGLDDLKKIKKLSFDVDTFNNGGYIYQYNDDILYKIVSLYFFCDEVERNIDFQIKNPIIHTPFIYDKLYINHDFVGYSMENIKNSFTFKKAISMEIDSDICMNVILNIYEVIRYLHDRNILLGDIHMDNFLIDNKGNGYVIDLDCILYPGDEYKFQDLYGIRLNHSSNRINVNSKKTDNIKAMICCLSLLLGIDLERLNISHYEIDMENVYNFYIKSLGSAWLDNYFSLIMNGEEVEYFDEFLTRYYDKILGNEKVKFRKSLHKDK